MQAPTKRKDITPVSQEPDFLENEDEPEVTLPEGYDEMDFDDRKKSAQAEEVKAAEPVAESADAEPSAGGDEATKEEETPEAPADEPVTEDAKS